LNRGPVLLDEGVLEHQRLVLALTGDHLEVEDAATAGATADGDRFALTAVDVGLGALDVGLVEALAHHHREQMTATAAHSQLIAKEPRATEQFSAGNAAKDRRRNNN